MHTQAIIATPHASKLIKRLSKHWAHKFTIHEQPDGTVIAFEHAKCILTADETQLKVILTALSHEELQHYEQVVANHLQRMNTTLGETLDIAWQQT